MTERFFNFNLLLGPVVLVVFTDAGNQLRLGNYNDSILSSSARRGQRSCINWLVYGFLCGSTYTKISELDGSASCSFQRISNWAPDNLTAHPDYGYRSRRGARTIMDQEPLTLDEIRDGLADVIEYHNLVGQILAYLMAELERLVANTSNL